MKFLEEANLLCTVAEAFRSVQLDAERIARGGEPLRDLSPDGRLAMLAKRAAEIAGPLPDDSAPLDAQDYPDPLVELARAVEALQGLFRKQGAVADWGDGELWRRAAGEAFRSMEGVWKIEGGPEGLRRVLARELAGDCKTCRAVAYVRADAIFEREIARAECKAAVETAKAEMYKARGKAEAEAEAWARADDARNRAEEIARMQAERAAKAEGERDTLRGLLHGQLYEIGRDAKGAKHAAAAAHAEATRGRLAAEGAKDAATTAARASTNAETAAKENKRAKAHDHDLVTAFREFDARRKRGGTQMEIMEAGFWMICGQCRFALEVVALPVF